MILILAAVPFETDFFRAQIDDLKTDTSDLVQTISGQLSDRDILIAHSGIGIVNMALTANHLLERHPTDHVFLIGCGGSYPNSGLSNGDLILADSEIYGDLGVETEDTFLTLNGISTKNPSFMVRDVQNNYAFNDKIIEKCKNILGDVATGPCVTVNCCSGTETLGEKLEQRTSGLCENMEGAAAAQVCHEKQVPMIELRGISNPVGTRDPEKWDLKLGALTAQEALLTLIREW